MKCISLLLDGASDRSYSLLENKTPLQAAKLENLDRIASQSQCGLMTPLGIGLSLGTDQAHMLLFGYELKEYPSRTILDLIGENVKIDPEALYLRCSLATVISDEGYSIINRFTPDFSDLDIAKIIPDLKAMMMGYSFEFIHSYDSHGFIKITGHVSKNVSDSDPFRKDYVMLVESENQILADAINAYIKWTYDLLNSHKINRDRQYPGNMILTKWAGMYEQVEAFNIRNGMNGIIIGQSKLLSGIAKYLNMSYYHYESFEEGLAYALSCDYDYVHLHTKSPDEASHKKDPHLKVKALEAIDKLIKPLLDFEGLLIVTSDHSTPCSGNMIHSGETVAFMAKGEFIRQDDVMRFDEIDCSKGSVFLSASDYMNYIINASDRGALFHLRQGKQRRNHLSRTNYRKLL